MTRQTLLRAKNPLRRGSLVVFVKQLPRLEEGSRFIAIGSILGNETVDLVGSIKYDAVVVGSQIANSLGGRAELAWLE